MTVAPDPRDYVYDIESVPNFFCMVVRHRLSRQRWIFEVSDRRNDAEALYWFLMALEHHKCRMIGFNNCGYDYQVVHHCWSRGPTFTSLDAYMKTDFIINGHRDDVFRATVWPSDYRVAQIDLCKIHHFDNRAKATSLKTLEFNMRSTNIGDLPFTAGAEITHDVMEQSVIYCCHDVDETEKFFEYSLQQVAFREELIGVIDGDVMNFNDTKIGKKFFQQRLEAQQPGICGTSSKPRQTHRDRIPLAECIFPYVEFATPSLQRVLTYLKSTVLTETLQPPELTGLSATLSDGFTIDFGAGGGHGSLTARVVRPPQGWKLIDVDVASYYPSLAIKNEVFPHHLSKQFCDIYESLFIERRKHDKKSAINGMLKLALNGVYGDSNNVYGPFYDPQYTMTTTVNGQLLLAMLAEWVVIGAQCRLVQLNTDGITVLVPDEHHDTFRNLLARWEALTSLELEDVEYEGMWIRDVNNYIAKSIDGKVKRIGAYAYERAAENPATREVQWHKDHSALVVQKAVEAHMLRGEDIDQFVRNHLAVDPFDFMLKAKVPGGSWLELVDEVHGQTSRLQKVTRYIVAHTTDRLEKVMPPLPRQVAVGKTNDRRFAVKKGWNVSICDDLRDFRPELVNYDWYSQEAKKLIVS